MHRPSIARIVVTIVQECARRLHAMLDGVPAQQRQVLEDMVARSPRNRAEARRFKATKGRVARAGGGGSHSPLLSLHRRIERDQLRQEERFLQGRHVWG